jgi:hypothetical protein
MNIIITPFSYIIVIIFSIQLLQILRSDIHRLSESVIGLGSLIGLGRLRCYVQFPLIAYGRMFTPDWEDVLNFSYRMLLHDQTCFLLKELVECSLFYYSVT